MPEDMKKIIEKPGEYDFWKGRGPIFPREGGAYDNVDDYLATHPAGRRFLEDKKFGFIKD